MRKFQYLAVLLALLAVSGCIFSPKEDPPDDGGGGTQIPDNDTPENAILRFMGLYKAKDIVEYERMFTGDYTFEFSNAADANLVQKYSTGWFKEDEKIAAQNLFQGGTNSDGLYQEAALSIEVTLTPTAPTDDNGAGRDPNVYKVLLASVSVQIRVPGDITYVIGEAPPQTNRFFLVRGDYAQGLTEDQPADSLNWYIWNWRDESPPLKPTGPGSDLSAEQEGSGTQQDLSWGALKALRR